MLIDYFYKIFKNIEYILYKMKFIGLIVRCKDEPYVTEFVNYYISQGIDMIHIIDDDSNKEIYKDIMNNEKVEILL